MRKFISIFAVTAFVVLASYSHANADDVLMLLMAKQPSGGGGGLATTYNFTTFTATELDTDGGNGSITLTSPSVITFDSLGQTDDLGGSSEYFASKDMGASYFSGDFTFEVQEKVTSTFGTTYDYYPWGLSNSVRGLGYLAGATADACGFNVHYGNGFQLWAIAGGVRYSQNSSMAWTLNTTYYIKITRVGKVLTAYIGTDPTYATYTEAISVTTTANAPALRYVYGCSNTTSSSSGQLVSGTVNNMSSTP